MSADPQRARGEAFGRRHAGLCLVATAIAVAIGEPAVAGLVGSASLALFALTAGAGAALGAANVVTLTRLALVLLLSFVGDRDVLAGVLVLAVFALDGLDGALARKLGTASAFGERLDMECDALLVLVASLVLHASGRLGAYVLTMGALRYAYVLGLVLLEHLRHQRLPEAPRSQLARVIFGLVAVSLVSSSFGLEPLHEPLSVVATLALVGSFARSLFTSLSLASASQ